MQIVKLIAGLPGVGKTTLAKKLVEDSGGCLRHLDMDDYKVISGQSSNDSIDGLDVRRAYYNVAADEILRLSREEEDFSGVVLEEIFHIRALRIEMMEKLQGGGLYVEWIHVTCPFEVVKQRLEENPRQGHMLTTEQSLKLYRDFESLFEAFDDRENARLVSPADRG